MTNRESFTNNYNIVWQKIITKTERYNKIKQNLLQNVIGITKCDSYYKVSHNIVIFRAAGTEINIHVVRGVLTEI